MSLTRLQPDTLDAFLQPIIQFTMVDPLETSALNLHLAYWHRFYVFWYGRGRNMCIGPYL